MYIYIYMYMCVCIIDQDIEYVCVCDKSVIIKYAHSAVSFQPTNPSYEAKKLNLGPPKTGTR